MYYQMQQKVVASEIFRGKKEGYAQSLNQPFANSRIGKFAFSMYSAFQFYDSQGKMFHSVTLPDS
jgi:hypothetical protein